MTGTMDGALSDYQSHCEETPEEAQGFYYRELELHERESKSRRSDTEPHWIFEELAGRGKGAA